MACNKDVSKSSKRTTRRKEMTKGHYSHMDKYDPGKNDVTGDSLRHTWASRHVQAGTPLEVLQKLGGWSSLQLVLRYAHLSPGLLAQYADNASAS